jgi:hypothetical protein
MDKVDWEQWLHACSEIMFKLLTCIAKPSAINVPCDTLHDGS